MKIKNILFRGYVWACAMAALSSLAAPPAVPGEYVVQLKQPKGIAIQSMDQRLARFGLKFDQALNASGSVYLLKTKQRSQAIRSFGLDESSVSEEKLQASVIQELSGMPDVEIVEPNYIYRISMGPRAPSPSPSPTPTPGDPEESLPGVIPSDTRFPSLWGMRNTGQADSTGRKGKVGADIDANNAWFISKGSKDIVVAVIDSGVDYNHPDLKNNMWSKAGQPNVHGFNAITGSLDPMDDNSHGTHCAGTIGAAGDNGLGVVGVNWHVSIMAIKFLASDGSGNLANAIKGIDWARQNGAQVMSNSWGGGAFSQTLLDAIRRARDAGILFVAAAGNTQGGHDNDASPSYPASYVSENVISVAATNNLDQLSSFSHYGAKTVHIAAPGENILSTFPNNQYQSISGTSMATPHVAGAAALLLSKEPRLSYAQLKTRLLSNVDRIDSLKTKVSSGGRLNVYKALVNGAN